MGQTRFLFDNKVWLDATLLIPSSEYPPLPATFLKDQLRQKPWRTKTGWTIVAGFNDKLDVFRTGPGDFTVTIPEGTYATGQDLAAAIQAGLESADSAPVWGVDYGVVAAGKFRIRDAAGAPVNFNLEWSTGANAATSIGKDLGFNTAADDTGTSTYTADFVAYQSRHYLKLNRTDAVVINAQAAAILEHNLGMIPEGGLSTATTNVRIQANATDSWASPALDRAFDIVQGTPYNPNLQPHVELDLAEARLWWRLLIEDVSNPTGYVELGIVHLGEGSEGASASVNPRDDLANAAEDFSAIETGIDGTHFVDKHRARDRWAVTFDTVTDSDAEKIDALIAARGAGENWLLVWDENDANGRGNGTDGTTYGFYASTPSKQYIPDPYWTYSLILFEAL